jgi:hypothetical protein
MRDLNDLPIRQSRRLFEEQRGASLKSEGPSDLSTQGRAPRLLALSENKVDAVYRSLRSISPHMRE